MIARVLLLLLAIGVWTLLGFAVWSIYVELRGDRARQDR